MLKFIVLLFLMFIVPTAVVSLVLIAIHHYRDDRKYLEFEEEEYEGQVAATDMPKEPHE